MLEITECNSPSEWKAFERVAEDLHRDDPAFVPPFPGSIAKYLSPKSAFHQLHGRITPFLARREGRPVGRLAAIRNHSHNAYHNDTTGFFGFFDCENNPDTARALFEKASGVLTASGLTSLRGPYNPTINDECGVLLSGFDKPPMIGLTWNPDYYESLLEASGFRKVRTLYSLRLPLHRLAIPPRHARVVERLQKRASLTLRTMNLPKIEDDLKIVHSVYNATLERNWGFVPIAMEELLAAASDLRAFADPGLLLIGRCHGQDAGVAITLPNFNEILAATKHTPHWLRLLHIAFLMKTRKIATCRQTVLGVVPEFRDRGLDVWLVFEQFRVAKKGYKEAGLGWLEESNSEIIKICKLVGGEKDCEWGIFERPLANGGRTC